MQRICLRLLVASTTFVVGVMISAAWVVWLTPDPVSEFREAKTPYPLLQSPCFPGRGQKLDLLQRAESNYFPRAWWLVEGVQEGYYHVAHRQSPDSGAYREVCLYMLKLSGLPLDESKGEIY